MKKNAKYKLRYHILIFTFLNIFSINSFSQNPVKSDVCNDIASNIRAGNSKEIAHYFNTTVDLTILTQEDIYNKTQAELIVKNFFVKNTPKAFNIIHQGTSKEGSKYAIGTLETNQGGTFRTYLLIKQIAGKNYIQELRFEKE